MNQIPNIEEAVSLIVEMKVHGDAELEEDVRTVLHHQLQKAREEWLREEIVKLKEAKLWEYNFQGKRSMAFKNYNQALQTIIDRYQSELNQDKKYTMGVDFAKRDHSELAQTI